MKLSGLVAAALGGSISLGGGVALAQQSAPAPSLAPVTPASPPSTPLATTPAPASTEPDPVLGLPQTSAPAAAAASPVPAAPSVDTSPATPVAPPSHQTELALALHTNGFFSTLDGGAFLGARVDKSTVWGVGFNLSSATLSHTGIGISLVPGAKFVLKRAANGRVELVVDAEVGFTKYYITDHRATAAGDGYGLFAQAGPGLRLWLVDSLALSYSGLFGILYRGDRREYAPGDARPQSVNGFTVDGDGPRNEGEFATGFAGRLALLGIF